MKSIQQKKLENQIYIVGIGLPVLFFLCYLLLKVFPDFFSMFYMPCIFYKVTGLYCPGCGGTRAVLSFFKGEFFLSFCYHPLVLYTAVVYLWYMLTHTVEKLSRHKFEIGLRYRDMYLWLALAVLIINTAVKDIALTAFDTDILKLLDEQFLRL